MSKEQIEEAFQDLSPYGAHPHPENQGKADAWEEGFKAGANWREGQEGGWVDVKDGLPEYDVEVLVRGEAKGMNPQMGGAYTFITRRQNLKGTPLAKDAHRYQDKNQFKANYVTHWMPLPNKPPKPKTDDPR